MSFLATIISFGLEVLTTVFGLMLYTYLEKRKLSKVIRKAGEPK